MNAAFMNVSTAPSADRASPRTLHVFAVATLLATLPLIFMGGLVTTKGAGMSVPDWPNTYGYNMFLFPPSLWIGGIFYEHTHRLLGTLVGLLAVGTVLAAFGPARHQAVRTISGVVAVASLLATAAFLAVKISTNAWGPAPVDASAFARALPHLFSGFASLTILAALVCFVRSRDDRRWVRLLALAVLASVCVQGIKGGLRVDLVSIELAIAHGIFAQVILCLMAGLVFFTSPRYAALPDLSADPRAPHGRKAMVAAFAACGVILCQLVVGALMRHTGSGLAIPDLPLAYGHVLPPTTPEGLAAANAYRVSLEETALKPVTLPQIWLHFGHRVGAIVVSAALLHLAVKLLARLSFRRELRRAGFLLIGLLLAQVSLGLATVYFRKPADVTTVHHTLGALILMLTFLVALRTRRLFLPRTQPAGPLLAPSPPPPTSIPALASA